ncbi:LacI family transcriptional regulator [Herbiconiux moechotypicola]|uniref:LacI family DNA-binding transcriptional regulator n=1 Tax=Herbiconiux moechotypicola TaxID=637393 RepID=A0ABP5QL01_9MICO|nr:LacI family DNA-binding transcriptional regulator [Herbiconiux moechotypicola]MCS5731424.1 LacI family transcriptional regulator [Herbiconiux moechotypicola]
MVKIGDVAREAGVSIATVSRALNNHPTVNPELVDRVREAADRLGYRPNGIARNLRRQSTDVLALVISDVSNPFFTAVTRGVEDVAQRNGYSVLLCNADEQPEKEATYLRVAEQEQVAGVIISPHSAGTDVSRLVAAGIPLTVIDRPLGPVAGPREGETRPDARGAFDSVMVESVGGARLATEHLLAAGWVRPGCITGPLDAATAEQRLAGYLAALGAAPREVQPLVARGPFRQAGGRAAAAELLDAAEPADRPDALFVANAPMALGVLEAVRERGLRVGIDLGMVVFDDAPWAPFIEPAMTVIAQPAYRIGERAAELLVARIRAAAGAGPVPPTAQELLTTDLVVRASSLRA